MVYVVGMLFQFWRGLFGCYVFVQLVVVCSQAWIRWKLMVRVLLYNVLYSWHFVARRPLQLEIGEQHALSYNSEFSSYSLLLYQKNEGGATTCFYSELLN